MPRLIDDFPARIIFCFLNEIEHGKITNIKCQFVNLSLSTKDKKFMIRKLLGLLGLFFISKSSFGQAENMLYSKISAQFEQLYNSNSYDSIFALFSTEMQKALPQVETVNFFSNLKSQVGQIKKRQFVKYEKGTFASYKTEFDRAFLAVNISVDINSKINGLFVKPFEEDNSPKIERNNTKLILPFTGEWTVFWGGDTKALNYHVETKSQKNAFDILIMDEKGKSYKTNGRNNEDYYAFGKELIAPCDAEVVLVVDGVKDNIPGELNPVYVPGNTVVLKTANNEFLFFAHFKQRTIKVSEGEKVKQGQLLGLCGNSGNSSEPHLHFHIQNVENMIAATGAKCFFERIKVNGEIKNDYSPIKKDKISNN